MQEELTKLLQEIIDFSVKNLPEDIKLPTGSDYKSKKQLFSNAVYKKVLDNSKAIQELVSNSRGLIAYSVCRNLFEQYLATRLVLEIDNDTCLECFYLFPDFQVYEKYKKVNENSIKDEENKKSYRTAVEELEKRGVKRKYEEAVDKLKPEFKKVYPHAQILPSKNDGWWLGMQPSTLSTMFGGDILDLYLKKYWDFSNASHPSPFGILQYVTNDRDENHTWEISSLVFCIHIVIWIFGMLVSENKEQADFYNEKIQSLDDIVMKHLEKAKRKK